MIAILAAFALAASHASDPIVELESELAPERAVTHQIETTIGLSAEGRPIVARAANGIGQPADASAADPRSDWPLVLTIGCIHGDECAGVRAVAHAWRGCPPPGAGLITVDNLNPDGLARGTRLNARGVDLNRNFAQDWRPIGIPGDPEHSGTQPFSEPETRLARELIRRLHPDVTIWFHQQAASLVRAWGASVPAARAYARLAGLPFVRMPWMDGTAPNWQNHAFPGSASFVVELPDDGPVDADRLGLAIFRLATELPERG